jgi:hypothetical protein
MFFQALRERRVICVASAGARVDYDVHRGQFMLMQTKRFTNQALDAIATNRIADQASSDRQTQSRMRTAIMPCENGEEIISEAARLFVDAVEFGFLSETLCRCERPRVDLQLAGSKEHATRATRVLHCEPLTALRATTRQNLASSTSGHASTETVRPLPMNIAGLISALHAETRGEICAKTSTWWAKRRPARVRSTLQGVKRAARKRETLVNLPDLWITRAASV